MPLLLAAPQCCQSGDVPEKETTLPMAIGCALMLQAHSHLWHIVQHYHNLAGGARAAVVEAAALCSVSAVAAIAPNKHSETPPYDMSLHACLP